jgi:DNA-binding NarL/FixJ family response regulator
LREGVVRFLNIFVVEDFDPFRRFICSKLQSMAEFHITQVSDGSEAVRKAQELQPDLILLDIGLPKLDGIEVAKRIRKIVPLAKILFLSVNSDPDVIRGARGIGAMGYIHKSRVERDLLPAIHAAVEGKQFVSAGLGLTKSMDWGLTHRHEIVFSSDDELLQDSLASFIAAALMAGDAAIVWATEPHRDKLRQRLKARGVGADAAIRAGTYIAADAAETADPVHIAGVIRSLIQAAYRAGKEHPRVAVCGERAGRLWGEGRIDEAIRLEQLFNELAKDLDELDILCVYPVPQGHDDKDAFSRLCAEHSEMSFLDTAT